MVKTIVPPQRTFLAFTSGSANRVRHDGKDDKKDSKAKSNTQRCGTFMPMRGTIVFDRPERFFVGAERYYMLYFSAWRD